MIYNFSSMAATIKLSKFGKKGYPTYRIVIVDKRKNRNSDYLEKIGLYNPNTEPKTISVDQTRLQYWLSKGVQVSEGVRKLLVKNIKV